MRSVKRSAGPRDSNNEAQKESGDIAYHAIDEDS